MAAKDGFKEYYTEKIWALIPEVYKTEDGSQPRRDVLRKIVEVIAGQAAVTRRSVDRLWEDQHIETADDWAVPYIGDLVGTRPLAELDPRARRVDVARTIFFRRRRGTPILLETLVRELSGWDVVLVEAFRRLGRTFHRLDRVPVRVGRFTRTPQGGTADLRSSRAGELQPGPFDEFYHTVDVRRLRGQLGWFNIRKLNFHLYRLEVYEIDGADAYELRHAGLQTFTLDPSGRDIQLFSRGNVDPSSDGIGPVTTLGPDGKPFPISLVDPRSGTSKCGRPDEWEVKKPIPCRLLGNAEYRPSLEDVAAIKLNALVTLSPTDSAALDSIVGMHFRDESSLRERLTDRGVYFAEEPPTHPVWYDELLSLAITDDSGKKNLYPSSVGVQWPGVEDVVPREAVTSADLSNRDCRNVPANPVVTTLIDPKLGRFAPVVDSDASPVVTTMNVALPMTLMSSGGAWGTTVKPSDVAVFGSLDSPTAPSIELGTEVRVYRGALQSAMGVVANAGLRAVHLGAGARTGNIWSIGNVALEGGALVSGAIRSSGSIAALPSQVTGARTERARINPRLTVIAAVFPETTPPSATYSSDAILPPGDYGSITVTSGEFTLQAGHYTFESLTFASTATLNLDTRSEPVFVAVHDSFDFAAATKTFEPARLRIAVFGTAGARISDDATRTPFQGTVVAMLGPIEYDASRPCLGALLGNRISVQAHAEIRHVAFAAWESQT